MLFIYLTGKHNLQASNVKYNVDIHDKFALCKLVQTYNITQDIPEAKYQFPVDYNSAFCELIIKTPRGEIKGLVKEKKEARQIYETAKREGRQTFLTEESESDRDIYELSMGNLLKDDVILVQYTYITELVYRNEQNIFYVPSFISPRYKGLDIPNPNHSVELNVTIHNQIQKFACTMPNISAEIDENKAVIKHQSKMVLDADIEISYDTSYKNKMYSFNAEGYHMGIASFMTKIKKDKPVEEIVFILDCSGSMEGDRIKTSKKAIIYSLEKMQLHPNYKFNIMVYGDKSKFYQDEMRLCNENNIKNAISYCNKIDADMGGTETLAALRECLKLSKKCNFDNGWRYW